MHVKSASCLQHCLVLGSKEGSSHLPAPVILIRIVPYKQAAEKDLPVLENRYTVLDRIALEQEVQLQALRCSDGQEITVHLRDGW